MMRIVGPHDPPRYSGAMLVAWQRLVAIGTGLVLVAGSGGQAVGAPPTSADRTRAKPARKYLIHLIDGGDPIVVPKYTEQDGQVLFEKYGGMVSIPRYEVLRIVPDDGEDTPDALPTALPPPTPPGATDATLYVATRSGANVRASNVGTDGPDVRVSTPEGSLSFQRTDLVGVLRVPAGSGLPEAWITLFGAEDWVGAAGQPSAVPSTVLDTERPAWTPTLSDRPHLLQLANGVVIQVDGFWVEAGEIRFRRLGGVVGFALGEIARLLPQETEPVRGRTPARFVRQLDSGRLEVRLREGVKRVRLIGVDPVANDHPLEDPWAYLDRELLVYLEFDRERSGPDGDWLAYLYLPNGRMLNAELIRVGLAKVRAETRNIRYLDLFQEIESHH
jgi:hypothetical protein